MVGVVIIRREEEDRSGLPTTPQGGADLQTVSLRKEHREKDDIIVARAAEAQSAVGVVSDVNDVAVVPEAVRHESRDGRMLDEKNLHRPTLAKRE